MARSPLRDSPAAPRPTVRVLFLLVTGLLLVLGVVSCGSDDKGEAASTADTIPVTRTIASAITGAPDELPTMANPEPPFRYPAELYGRRVQGNVTLRLYLDSTGTVIPDSTRVEEGSGHAELDSAALRGSRALRFNPARRRGTAIAVSLLYPVYFRHPEAAPLPGDSVLR